VTRFVTADLVDAYADQVQGCDVQFRQFGGRRAFHGRIRTVRTFEDNALVRAAVSTPGEGAVLVIDGGASLRVALVGDMIGALAVAHGWAGLVIYGAVRDSIALAKLEIGIKALGTNPLKSAKQGLGEIDVPVTFGGATLSPGSMLYSDDDGLLVSAGALEPPGG
jgi:regulator of ribonuclease activity A